MTHVATLVTNSESPAISDAIVAAAAAQLENLQNYEILADRIAVDLYFTPAAKKHKKTIETAIRNALERAPIDVVVQDAGIRRKKLLIADMDSTMIGQECIDELGAELGIKDKIAAITEKAMQGKIAYESSLRERVALLQGLDISIADEIIANRITITPGAVELVHTMKTNGSYCALVSSGFSVFTAKIARMIGFHEDQSNELLEKNDILTGEVREPILEKNAKKRKLIALVKEHDLDINHTLAVGDGANDVEMLQTAGLGVAYHAKPVVADLADARIQHSDLTALLYIQGYKKQDFVSASDSQLQR